MSSRKLLLSMLSACCIFAAAADVQKPVTYELGDEAADDAFWKSDPVLFVRKHQVHGFKFTSEDRTSADSRRDGGVSCFGIPVYETRVLFKADGGISRVELMLYNRGGTEQLNEIKMEDGVRVRHVSRTDGNITRERFFDILKTVRGRLTKDGGKIPQPKDERTASASVRQRVQTWAVTKMPSSASLTWNYTQNGKNADTFRAGYIRLALEIAADGKKPSLGQPSDGKTAKAAKKIVENVIRDPRGDVFIDNVPMVDQGAKGYCSVASSERVMRYYGLDVDEHEIAEAAGTSAEGGTSTLGMKQAVDRIGKRYRLATVLLYGDFEDNSETRIANINREVTNYNKAAKKLKKDPIPESVYIRREGNTTYFSAGAVDQAMDPEVLKEMKVNGSQKSKFTKFKKDIHQFVDSGMPLYWSVKLGVYPEDDLPQKLGYHMRLIIGYNDKKGEILYTDSWGKGHELKRMPASWAWTISKCLMAMKPLK